MILFAHHLEPQHYPILACFLAAGFWIGWNLMSRLVTRTDKSPETIKRAN